MPMVPFRRAPRETDRQPARRQPRRGFGYRFAACFAVVLLAGAMATVPPVRAEPIALAPGDAEPAAAGVQVPLFAQSEPATGVRTDETAIAAAAPPAVTGAEAELGDTPPSVSPRRPAAAAEARAPQPHSGPGRPTRDAWPDGAVRRPTSALSVAESELAGEEADWEREIKEAIRPIYDDLAARGVIDAVQGLRSYLAMLGVLLSGDSAPPAGDRTRAGGVAETRVGSTDAGWEPQTGRIDSLMPGKSEAQIEKEKLIATIIVKEWIAAVLPWIYALVALVIVWQIAKATLSMVGSRSTRAQRRAAKSRRRSADTARTRARS